MSNPTPLKVATVWSSTKWRRWWYAALAIGCVPVVFIAGAVLRGVPPVNFSFTLLVEAIIIIGFYGFIGKHFRREFLEQYVSSKGWLFTDKSSSDPGTASLFRLPGQVSLKNAFEGFWDEIPARGLTFSRTVQHGKSSATYEYMVVSLEVETGLPPLLVASKGSDMTGVLSDGSIQSVFKGTRVHLEGDFDDHFIVETPENLNVQARMALTPDVMEILAREAAQYCLELSGKSLYLYKASFPQSGEELDEMFTLLRELVRRWKSEVADFAKDATVQEASQQAAAPTRAYDGRYAAAFTFVIGLIAFLIYLYVTNSKS